MSPEGRALRRAAFAAVLDGRREPLAALAAAAGASDAEADDLVGEASHPAARLWNAEHAPGRSMAGGTCGLMNLFCSPEHLRAWLDGHPDARGDAVDLAGAAELGRAWWGPLR